MDKEKHKRVAIWIRVSTEDQARGESPEHHEKRARAYAEAKGWKVVELYDLSGVSGKSVMSHPEAMRMMDHVREGHISGLIFSKLARLARNTKELLDFSDFFRAHDADLISIQEAIDTSSPAGRLFYTMIAAMAQWEREEIAERVAVSIPIRAKLGKNLGGTAMYGYQWVDNQLVPDSKEAPVRKLIYELFLEHKRKKTVARVLNERGYRTRGGKEFYDRTIERLLRDPTAKGLRRSNYTTNTERKGYWKLKPKSEWVYTEVEPIVSAELWDACNAILDEQRKQRKPPSRKTVHVFAGLTHCSCGAKMYVPSNSPKYICSKCRNKVPIVDLDGIFQEQLKHLFFSPQEVAEYLKQGDEVMQQKEELIGVLEGEQRKIRREMDKLYDLYMSEEITKQGFGEKYHPLAKRLAQVEDQLPALQAELDVLKIHYLSSDEIVAEARDLYGRWNTLSAGEKRTIVEAITESIVVGKDEITINLHYLPSSADRHTPGDQGGQGPSEPPESNDQGSQPSGTGTKTAMTHQPDQTGISNKYNGLDHVKRAAHPRRLFARRYNQSALLARALGRATGLPVLPDSLRRSRNTPSQGRLSAAARRRNVAGAFRTAAGAAERLGGRRVLLVDDVMTTGATVEACARALKRADAAGVDVLTLARVVRASQA